MKIGLLRTPRSLEEEHEELLGSLRQAADYEDKTGKAVTELLKILEPHFEKEERVAMPLLGVLPELVSRQRIRNLQQIIDSQRALWCEYENMFQEHRLLGPLIERAKMVATRENHLEIADALDALVHHARVEEEVLYPAALLAGTLGKLSLEVPWSKTIPIRYRKNKGYAR